MYFSNILVLCRGNICRSPMAEYFLKNVRPDLNIESAGISGLIGLQADEKAIISMVREGIDISAHIAKKLNSSLIRNADLILVMSDYQKQYIETTWSFSKGKTFRLGHWRNIDIIDPYQHRQTVFNETCHLIKSCVNDWKKTI